MQTPVKLEEFMKNGFKLLRCTKDPSSIKTMLKHFEDAVQKQYGGTRQPRNAAEGLAVPTMLLSKGLDKGQTKMIVDDECCGSSSTPSCLLPTTSKSIAEVCSSPTPTITLEQVAPVLATNIGTDSEMETEDIESRSCCVCKESIVMVGNSLKECFDCHSTYHQNCHTPPVTEITLNDPQIVWYCSDCRPRNVQQKVERSSRKRSRKSSFENTTGEKSSSSKTSQGVNKRPRKSKSSSEKISPENCLPSHQPDQPAVMSVVEKRVPCMKKKAARKSEKKK